MKPRTTDDDREIPAVNISNAAPLNLYRVLVFARAPLRPVSRVRTGDLGAHLTPDDPHPMQKMELEYA